MSHEQNQLILLKGGVGFGYPESLTCFFPLSFNLILDIEMIAKIIEALSYSNVIMDHKLSALANQDSQLNVLRRGLFVTTQSNKKDL